jgi:hypothetical protein
MQQQTKWGDYRNTLTENGLQISFTCYLCGVRNTFLVPPFKEEHQENGTLTLYFAETIFFCCPDCGQKYAIPNRAEIKTVPCKLVS